MLVNQTTVNYPLLNMCDPLYPALDLLSVNNSFMLVSPNYPSPYPRGSDGNCSLNVTLSRGMQMHLALVDLDLVSTGVWPPPWQQRLLAYPFSWSNQQTGTGASFENSFNETSLEPLVDTRNCTGEHDILRVTASKFAFAI